MKRSIIALSVLAAACGAHAQTVEDLQKQIDILASEIESLKTAEQGQGALENLHIGGYGEHHYNNYRNTETGPQKDDQVDAHRFVLFFGYDFSDRVRLVTELELEHGFIEDENECEFTVPGGGLAPGDTVECEGESAPGEVELEQAYIEIDTSDSTRVKLGQFLVPVGILNETHEPETFYGVERNKLENAVIPTTWWETGAWFSQDLGAGLSYDLALHSGLQVEDDYGIRSGRQKSAKAIANDGAWTGRVRYVGLPGLDMAVTYQRQNDMHQSALDGELGFAGDVPDAKGELLEAHARYTLGGLQLTALHAAWDIDSDAAEAAGKDEQSGEYVEAGYKLLDELGIFARHTQYDLAERDDQESEVLVNTYGVNYWVHPQVVLKADYQNVNYKDARKDDKVDDSVNLGIGWSF
ncbi:MAG: porin [Alcanivoracaceae bacterium]|nr:porin [Alcanivoracaceae bacterium]